jgi:16S rRNA processing protein RimM
VKSKSSLREDFDGPAYFCSMTEYFKIGKLVSAFGLKGELILQHNLGKKTSLKGLQALFVEERKASFIPWFIEATRIKSDEEIYLKLQDVNTREGAIKLTQKEVWLMEADFKKFSAKSSPINLLGYSVIEKNNELGKILEVIEQPHQLLCRIEIDAKEVLIPLHENTIIKIDHKQKQVIVELPEGLLEIYL